MTTTVLTPGGLQWPLFAPTAASEPENATVVLDGVEYAIDITKFARASIDATREGVTREGDPSEGLFDHEGTWWRHSIDFTHGADQQRFDFEPTSDPARFRNSYRLVPWALHHDSPGITIAPSHASALALATFTKMAVSSPHIYASDGTNVKRSSDLSAWTTLTAPGGTVHDLCTDGNTVYVATSTVINRYSAAATTPIGAIGTANDWDRCWFVANRLIGSIDSALYTVGASTKTLIHQHFNTNFVWSTVFAIGSKIYAGGYANDQSELYTLVAIDDGSLIQGQEVASFTNKEKINCAVSYAGIAVIGTSFGVRLATPGGDGTLTYGALIETAGTDSVYADDNFVWYNGLTIATEANTVTGIGRLDLATFVDTLLPAHAPEIQIATAGAVVLDVCRFLGRTVFEQNASGTRTLRATSTTAFETSAVYYSGQVYLGTIEQKRITGVVVRHGALATNDSVAVTVVDQDGATLMTGTNTTDNSTGFSVIPTEGSENLVDWFEIQITLSSNGTTTPLLISWQARGYPVPRSSQRWVVPLMIAANVARANGQFSFDSDTEVERLVALWRAKTPISFRLGSTTHRVRIDKFEQRPTTWDGQQINSTFMVELISL